MEESMKLPNAGTKNIATIVVAIMAILKDASFLSFESNKGINKRF